MYVIFVPKQPEIFNPVINTPLFVKMKSNIELPLLDVTLFELRNCHI